MWPPKPPLRNAPGVLWGELYLAYVHSQMNPQTWTKSWCQSDSFPRLLNCWPPKTPQVPPLVYRGAICLAYIHSHVNLHMCAKCGANRPNRSVAFSRICAKVSSAFRRCTRWLAQKHAKKQHLYIEHFNSGPNMQTSTSLTFFPAIFVAFRGALAKELMIFCRHVRTELYI